MPATKPQDRQLSAFEHTGVIGAESVRDKALEAKVEVKEAQARPADAAAIESDDSKPAVFARVEPEARPENQPLPDGFSEWESYKLANANARENYYFVLIRPGHVFTASGRYHNAQKVGEVYDVVADQIVPDGLYLFPDNYLIPELFRNVVKKDS